MYGFDIASIPKTLHTCVVVKRVSSLTVHTIEIETLSVFALSLRQVEPPLDCDCWELVVA